MNKEEFISELGNTLSYPREKCLIINDILESNFFISKKSKDKIIEEFMESLNINDVEAERVYEVAVKIVGDEVKYKLKHPFKSKD